MRCTFCEGKISDLAITCPHCGRMYPHRKFEALTECLHCKSMVLKEASRCLHCHANPNIPNVSLPQHKTGTFCAGVIAGLWQWVPLWSITIKAAAILFILATVISFWRGNKVNKGAACIKNRVFGFAGELALFLIYSGIALIVLEILNQRFF